MTQWLSAPWKAFAASYDAREATVQSSPSAILIGVGPLVLGMLLIGYHPELAAQSGFSLAVVPALVAVGGAACSFVAWRHKATGPVGTACVLMATTLYTSALALAAALSQGSFSTGFAVALALFLLAFPARVYGLSLPIAAALCLPPALVFALLDVTSMVGVIFWVACLAALTTSHRNRQRMALVAQIERLRNALGAADRIADQSMETALSAALLDIGSFLHELRNARAAFVANLQYLQEAGNLTGEPLEALHDTITAHKREDALIEKTLETLRRKGQLPTTEFVLQDAIETFVHGSDDVPHVRTHLRIDPFRIKGNPDHLHLVLRNLVRNAKQAGATEVVLNLLAEENARGITLEVADNGIGLSPEVVERAFLPFGPAQGGNAVGLGLYLSRRYVELMGGKLHLASATAQGAAFRMRLPGRFGARAEHATPP